MTRLRQTCLFLLVATTAACAPAHETETAPVPATDAAQPMTGDTSLTGIVRVVGSLPVSTQVVIEADGRHTAVEGALADEIGRLSGAEVEVRGRLAGRAIEAADYEIRSVDGRPVTVGTVERIEEGMIHLRTKGGELVYVAGSTSPFRVGQKVWVQGPQYLRIQSFGIIGN
jgi:hypothetical protein